MPVTLIVEPDHSGHRFQAVANVAMVAARTDDVVLLTSRGATGTEEFGNYLDGVRLKVDERFAVIHPPTRLLAATVAESCAVYDVTRVVVMDADQSLKRWWYVAPAALRSLGRRPKVVFMLVRYPTKVPLADWHGWAHKISKGTLALLAMATGTLHRVGGFAGREDTSRGWLVHRVRDPATCSAHSRDREQLRRDLGLPVDRRLVGILGVISRGKNVPLLSEAVCAAGTDADLLVAGAMQPDVAGWVDQLPTGTRRRLVVMDEYLSNDVLDRLVAACDVVSVAQDRNAPSGIMGKALAAETPVVSAGSVIRGRELAVTHGGLDAEMTVAGLSAAIRELLDRGAPVATSAVAPATGETFGESLLGTGPSRRPHRRQE